MSLFLSCFKSSKQRPSQRRQQQQQEQKQSKIKKLLNSIHKNKELNFKKEEFEFSIDNINKLNIINNNNNNNKMNNINEEINNNNESLSTSSSSSILSLKLPLSPIMESSSSSSIENDFNDNDFHMKPMRLNFMDDINENFFNNNNNSSSNDCDINNNIINKSQPLLKNSSTTTSICNLDKLFGNETISLNNNNNIYKINNPLRLIIHRDSNGSLIDYIVPNYLDYDIDKKLIMKKSTIKNEIDNDYDYSIIMKRLFNISSNKIKDIQSIDNNLICLRYLFNQNTKSSFANHDIDELNNYYYLNRLFNEKNMNKRKILTKKQIKRLKNTSIAKNKRRNRRINQQNFDDLSLAEFFNSNVNNDDKEIIKKSCDYNDGDNDSLIEFDSGIGSTENNTIKIDESIKQLKTEEYCESFLLKKEFWKQLSKSSSKTKNENSPPSPTIKSFRSLPEPLTKNSINEKIKSNFNIHNDNEYDDIINDDKYELLKNFHKNRYKIGECSQYLNKFELIMRKYYPELEKKIYLSKLFTLLMYGLPKELYWLYYWIQTNFNIKDNDDIIDINNENNSSLKVEYNKIDFVQIKTLILNEEQSYIRRNINNKQQQLRLTTKSIINDFQLQSLNFNNNINTQRRWSISMDRHTELIKFHLNNYKN